jgi:DNA-binding XRE family transcriptional regulator
MVFSCGYQDWLHQPRIVVQNPAVHQQSIHGTEITQSSREPAPNYVLRDGVTALGNAGRDAGNGGFRVRQGEEQQSEFVFPAESATGHMANLKKAWDALCKFAELEGWRIHDLRHAFASVMVNSGASLPIIGKILGHTQTGTTQRYAHLQENPAKKAAEEAAAKIAAITEKTETAADIEVRRKHASETEDVSARKLTLQELRFREGLSQKELAQLSGVTFQSVSAFENGRRPIGKAMAQKLAGPLGVDWMLLLAEK